MLLAATTIRFFVIKLILYHAVRKSERRGADLMFSLGTFCTQAKLLGASVKLCECMICMKIMWHSMERKVHLYWDTPNFPVCKPQVVIVATNRSNLF